MQSVTLGIYDTSLYSCDIVVEGHVTRVWGFADKYNIPSISMYVALNSLFEAKKLLFFYRYLPDIDWGTSLKQLQIPAYAVARIDL